MTSVDELFKGQGSFSGSTKRKLEIPDAQTAYKSTKLSKGASPNGSGANAATVEDESDDMEAGPELPPEDDAGDDEDGRFFGTGMSEGAVEALDYIDEQDADGYQEEKIDSAWLRRLVTTFERKISKNAEQRAKFENDPQKFMASEADLDAEVKSWSLLSEHPELYVEFAESGSVPSLVNLLAHENTDIAIGAIEIISELLDDDVQAEQEQWDALVAALLEADLLELLLSNLSRLDEEIESDRSGVYHSLAVIEGLASNPTIADKLGKEKVLEWLCSRIAKPEGSVGQNQQYAAEVLQVVLQSSTAARRRLASDQIDGVDLFLRLIAKYRKRDPPKDSNEEELSENVFDALTCVVEVPEGKSKFVQAEGVELCLIMLKDASKNIAQRAVRILDHAVGGQGPASVEVCEKVIDAAGLKPIFSAFMRKADGETTEHILGIFRALLRSLPGESAPRIRLLAKFAEKDYEKVAKLVQLRKDYGRRVAIVDKEIKLEQATIPTDEIEERSDEWFLRRLDGGLFHLQTIDVILAWLIAEDSSAKKKIISLFDGSLETLRESIEEQRSGLDTESAEDEDTREMLDTLLGFLA